MANESNKVVQVYELRSLGFKQLTGELETVNKLISDIAQNKTAASKGKGSVVDQQGLAAATRQLQAVQNAQAALNTSTETNTAKLLELVNRYKEATTQMQTFGTELGNQSGLFQAATTSAEKYKQELTAIVGLLGQTGGALPAAGAPTAPAPVVPPAAPATLPGQTPEQVQQLATAYAEEAAAVDSAVLAFQELTATAQTAIIPLQEQTGTLSANIALYNLNKAAIADLRAQMASLSNNTTEAGRQTGAYQARMAQLTAEERRLVLANRDLNQTVNSQVNYLRAAEGSVDQLRAKLAIFRNQYDGLSAALKAAPAGQALQRDIQLLNTQITTAEQATGRFQRNVGNYASTLFGYIKTAANILPGLGIQGIFLLAFQGLGAIFESIASGIGKGTKALSDFKVAQNDVAAALDSSTYKDAVANFNSLRINVDLAKQGFLDKDKVLQQYNDTLGKTTGQVSTLDEAEQAMVKNGPAYLRVQLLKTAATLALEEAAKKVLEVEKTRQKNLEDFSSTLTKGFADIALAGQGAEGQAFDQKQIDERNAFIKKAQEKKRADEIAVNQKAADQQLSIAEKFQADAAKLAQKFGFKFFGDGKGPLGDLKEKLTLTENQIAPLVTKTTALTKAENTQLASLVKTRETLKKQIADIEGSGRKASSKGDALGADNTNALNLIDAQLKTEISRENTRVNILRKNHELSYDEERQYLENIKDINEKYFVLKIKAIKGHNTKEDQERAALTEQLTDLELKSTQQIDAINKKQFDDRMIQLRAQHDEEVRLAQQRFQDVKNDPGATAIEKADAQLDLDRQLIAAQVSFNIAVDVQEQLLKQHSEKNARERAAAIAQIESQSRQDRIARARAVIADIQAQGDREVLQAQINFSALRLAVLENDKIGNQEKQAQLQEIDKAARVTLLTKELQALTAETAAKKQLYKQNLASDEEYLAAKKKQQEKAGELSAATTDAGLSKRTKVQKFLGKQITVKGKDLNGDGKPDDIDTGITIGQVLTDSFQLASSAMNEYFDAEAARVASSRDDALKRVDDQAAAEKKLAQARGASQAQLDSIDAAAQKKKDQITKESGEKLKRIKKEELAVTFATELAGIAANAAGNVANSATFGVAGAIQYAILSAVAIGRNALLLAQINRQQFAFGGNPDMETTRGGRVKGRPHSQGGNPFLFKGRVFEDEVDELNIIRTRNVPAGKRYTISGTHMQISSALNQIGGGIAFSQGAKVSGYAGGGRVPGSVLQPPLFIPRGVAVASGDNQATIQRLETQNALLMQYINATNNRLDVLQVQQVTSSVTDAQRKAVSQASVATIGKRN